MDSGRRQFLGRFGAVVTGVAAPIVLPRHAVQESNAAPDFSPGTNAATDLRTGTATGTRHEQFMWRAIEEARRNPEWPFGAVIVDNRTGEVRGAGSTPGRTARCCTARWSP